LITTFPPGERPYNFKKAKTAIALITKTTAQPANCQNIGRRWPPVVSAMQIVFIGNAKWFWLFHLFLSQEISGLLERLDYTHVAPCVGFVLGLWAAFS
jgi:hypothetical protein